MKTNKFWCAERVQRLVMSIFALLILVLLAKGLATIGLALLAFLSVMLFVFFVFDFCPSTWILNKIFGSCYCECKGENDENKL